MKGIVRTMARTLPNSRTPRIAFGWGVALLVPCVSLQVGCSTTLGGESPAGDGAGAQAGTSGPGSGGASGNATGGASGNATGGASGNATGGSATGGSATGGSAGTTPVCMPGVIDPGRSPMRRLNGFEYDNTVRDLMGATKKYSTTWPADNQAANSGFSNAADHLRVDRLVAEGFQKAAEEMAAAAVANLGALAPACNPTMMGAESCARSFIQAFGKQAFRRPLVDEEVTRYLGLFTTGSTGATYNDGVSLVIEAVLQSPNFLYRLEFGDPTATGNVVPLTSYELATRLSYFLWSTMPDDALFAAADANTLTTPAELGAQTERMLQNDHAKAMVRQFHREWLQVERAMMTKAVEFYPTYAIDLAAELVFEADRFMENVYWNNGSLLTLLTAPYSFMNGTLAQHYGIPGSAGTALVRVDLDPAQRSGILTLGGFFGRPRRGRSDVAVHGASSCASTCSADRESTTERHRDHASGGHTHDDDTPTLRGPCGGRVHRLSRVHRIPSVSCSRTSTLSAAGGTWTTGSRSTRVVKYRSHRVPT